MSEPVSVWIRRSSMARADGSNKAIKVGTRVRVTSDKGLESPVPVGCVGRVASTGVWAKMAIRAVGTTNAFRVEFDALTTAS